MLPVVHSCSLRLHQSTSSLAQLFIYLTFDIMLTKTTSPTYRGSRLYRKLQAIDSTREMSSTVKANPNEKETTFKRRRLYYTSNIPEAVSILTSVIILSSVVAQRSILFKRSQHVLNSIRISNGEATISPFFNICVYTGSCE